MPGQGQRLFFALWPPGPLARALADFAACHVRGRPLAAESLHLTLAFAGDVGAPERRRLEAAADAIGDIKEFELMLDRAGAFSRARVVWIGPTDTPMAAEGLAARLADAVTAVTARRSHSFRPHVTLARRACWRGAVTPPAFRWPVTAFTLVASTLSGRGARYRVLRIWPLARDADGAPRGG